MSPVNDDAGRHRADDLVTAEFRAVAGRVEALLRFVPDDGPEEVRAYLQQTARALRVLAARVPEARPGDLYRLGVSRMAGNQGHGWQR